MYVAKSAQPGVSEQPEGYTHVDAASVGAAETGADVGIAEIGADVGDVVEAGASVGTLVVVAAETGAAEISIGADGASVGIDDVGFLVGITVGATEIALAGDVVAPVGVSVAGTTLQAGRALHPLQSLQLA